MKVRTRFAPSPTGFLHIGGVYSALIDFAFAKKHRGQFIVRIEDTDRKRFVKGVEEKIYEWLDWAGINPDESPKLGGPHAPYRQSERLSLYRKYAQDLVDKGHAYYCFCSPERLDKVRKEKQKKGLPPMYDGRCRSLNAKDAKEKVKRGKRRVIRMKIPENEEIVVSDLIRGKINFNSKTIDDQVLLKSDGYPTYHLAVVVDDHLMEITHAVRGEEWLSSAPKYILLFGYFGWEPPILVHTSTIRNPDKSKLSKRQGHTSIRWFIKEGYLPEAIVNFLCLLGWSHPQEKEIFSLDEFVNNFDLKDLSPAGPVFDLKKLGWMNGVYIRKKADRVLVQLVKPFAPRGMDDSLIAKTIPLVKERMAKLSDYSELVYFLVREPKVEIDFLIKKTGGNKKTISRQLSTISRQLSQPKAGQPLAETIKSWKSTVLEKQARQVAAKNSWPIGKFFMAVRIALTGKTVTPPLFESMELLGKEKTIGRLNRVITTL